MNYFNSTKSLTHGAVLTMLQAAVAKAEEIGQPQCIVIVDISGELLGEIRMNGAKFLSRKSARAKARTAASNRAPTENVPEALRVPFGLATGGDVTGLGGGLPIIIEGEAVGGIGIGTGSAAQDIEVATAALMSIGASV